MRNGDVVITTTTTSSDANITLTFDSPKGGVVVL